MICLGIDPGVAGGIAWTDTGGGPMGATKFPKTETDIAALFWEFSNVDQLVVATIERVASTPQMGVTSAFTFGRGYGFLRGCLIADSIPFDEITPSTWQKEFGLIRRNKAETITQKKNRHKAKAQQLFPSLTVTHHVADAILIAEWARRQRQLGSRAE